MRSRQTLTRELTLRRTRQATTASLTENPALAVGTVLAPARSRGQPTPGSCPCERSVTKARPASVAPWAHTVGRRAWGAGQGSLP